MAQAIEMVRFTVKPGEEAALIDGRPGMLLALSEQHPGMMSARLARMDGGLWLDMIVWESRELALAAAEDAPGIPAVAGWLSHIAEVLGVEHADVVVAA
ncbi:MAG: hypothetical protein AVDCRST_MAG03-916 [uncultured Rubrobacteraceae bacterium]|uniref:Uncharacterized protein n=1 Tax=uncultured Rubrobacteraceae bacterium TaxID=349277 RepID=A0A6J4NSC3_9ACTN|nr:MAG: hypothetical protein AVDCRST_MAG03-916 [uncultured Rubrobacteraceae bacterium]